MQRLGGPSLSHGLLFKTPTPSTAFQYSTHRLRLPWPNRKDAPLRNHAAPFEASTLVLDLDAEDNRYVRPYEEDVDGVPTAKLTAKARALRAVEEPIAKFEQIAEIHDRDFKNTTGKSFNHWHISDYDILSVALKGLPTSDAEQLPSTDILSTSGQATSGIFKWNGIPTRARHNYSMAIAYMLRRQRVVRRLQPSICEIASFRRGLEESQNLFRLERFITNAFQTPQGYRLVQKCSDTLASTCLKIIQGGPGSPIEMLSFLNNLIMRPEFQGNRIPSSLFRLAHEVALRCRVFTTAQKHLKTMPNPLFGDRIFAALQILEESIAPVEPESVEESRVERGTAPRLLAIYGLLTGRILGEETWQPSLRDMSFKKCGYRTFELYVTCLARLGAFRTMWYIWHTHDTEESATSDQEDGSSRFDLVSEPIIMKRRGQVFDIAMQKALSTNRDLTELAKGPDFAHTANQFHKDCQLDMEAIFKSADTISKRSQAEHSIEIGQAEEIFGKPSIGDAMLALQSYLSQIPPSHEKHDEASPPTQNQ
ncbi:hypothetical protein F5Y05DRAFT_363542 [Hypoxylon sp. FL0543]|nr:hypothetical protein F5Y05DRAFT_363542 [Hypoxylon sp. FL0543]